MRVEFVVSARKRAVLFARFVPSNEQRSALDPDWFPPKNARQKKKMSSSNKVTKV